MSDQILSSAEFDWLLTICRVSDEAFRQEEPPFLSQLDDGDREDLRHFATERSCVSGEIIVRENCPGDHMYIIRSGLAVVLKGDLHAPMILGFRGKEDLIGEMALLENQPRSATVVALEAMSLWSISQESFVQLANQSPGFNLKMLGLLSARLRKSDEQYRRALAHGKIREETLRRLNDQVMRDPLTGLYNRHGFELILAQKFSEADQVGTEVGVLMLDVDHFKRINDTHGHQAGDAVLKALAKVLEKLVRSEDILCRYGGEEFVVVMPGAPLPVIRKRADMIRRGFQESRVLHQEKEISATLSIGIAMYPAQGSDADDVLAHADRALYQAKKRGRNRVVTWQPATAAEDCGRTDAHRG
jgi:diguanylate cyclase (GGDEF)-like protein